jgi:hydroxypyruvate reductase
MFDAALGAARPEQCLPAYLPAPPAGRTVVVGAGKASAEMTRVLESRWPGPLSGVVVTRYGHGAPCAHIRIMEAGHPVPDAAGEEASREILAVVSGLGADDLVIALMSGGGSALLTLPAGALTLADKQVVTNGLLAAGAPIGAINTLRKHLSAIKGGRLALAAAPARVCTLLISDVPGDDPALIASGPTVPDPTGPADARAVIARYGIAVPAAVSAHLDGDAAHSPDPADPQFARCEARLVASSAQSLAAAAAVAHAAGYGVEILGDALEGEARAVATEHARRAVRAPRRTVLLSGGELTVTLGPGAGEGGPSGEYALGMALALSLGDHRGITALACDTDGIDGTGSAAGAFADATTIARAREVGLDPLRIAACHDSHGLFGRLGDLVVTGPTRTNVNYFRAIVID